MREVIAIPGRPGFGSLLWWFQGPSSDLGDYSFTLNGGALDAEAWRLIPLKGALGNINEDPIAAQTFLLITRHAGQSGDQLHELVVHCAGKDSNIARSRTLPRNPAALQIVLASCYWAGNSRIHPEWPLPETYPSPHLRINGGDQVYVDMQENGHFPKTNDADDWDPYPIYYAQWRRPDFLSWMAACPNLCMADDHEFWNNYPSEERWPGHPDYTAPAPEIEARMLSAFMLYQGVLNANPDALFAAAKPKLDIDALRTFEFPGPAGAVGFKRPFSIFMLDTRTSRQVLPDGTCLQFCKPAWLDMAISWLENLKGPGMLVTGQSLVEPHGDEAELSDFAEQYGRLMQALSASPRNLALLTGDIHWCRAQLLYKTLSGRRPQHVEIVSSALSRISPFEPNASWVNSTGTFTWQGPGGPGQIHYRRAGQTNYSHNLAILTFAAAGKEGLKGTARWWCTEPDYETGEFGMVRTIMSFGGNQDFEFDLS